MVVPGTGVGYLVGGYWGWWYRVLVLVLVLGPVLALVLVPVLALALVPVLVLALVPVLVLARVPVLALALVPTLWPDYTPSGPIPPHPLAR